MGLRRIATLAVTVVLASAPPALAATGVAQIVGPDGKVRASAVAQAGWAYPDDGSLAQVADVAIRGRDLTLRGVSLVGGRIRIESATVGAHPAVTGLTVDDVAVEGTVNRVLAIPGVGWALVLQTAVIPLSSGATRMTTVAFRLHLTTAFGAVPAGSDLLVGYAAGSLRLEALTGAAREIPANLVPIYRDAGRRYHVPWSVLAAINRVETSFGRDLSVSSAGALGWMQFMPGTWRSYGVDATGDGRADPYDPTDAIHSAAHLLSSNGAARNLRGAVWLYNHSNAYVDLVLRLSSAYADGAPAVPVGVDSPPSAAERTFGIFSPVLLW